jgi:DNA-binding SARP family transcriptional activator/TolB-like protein
MIELRTLGTLDLRDETGREIQRVLAQPKRLALLVYLALTHTTHRRDELLALFWPDHDDKHARLALRQAVHFLRATLGTAVVANRSGEDVALGEGLVRCDATEFERALDNGKLAHAIDLYGGDFLPGFHVDDVSSDLEEWLDRQRQRFRASASRAAWALSEKAEAENNRVDAGYRARQAIEFAPDDEAGLRRLVSLLDRLGDRNGALRAYAEFARRLRMEFDVEPAAETRQLLEAVRSSEAISSVSKVFTGDVSPNAQPAASRDLIGERVARPKPARRRKHWRVPAVILFALLFGAVATVWLRRSRVTEPRTIAIGVIQNQGGGASEETARALTGLLATNLARVQGLSVISDTRLFEVLGQLGAKELTQQSFAEAARRAGAAELVEGVLYSRSSGALRLDLRRVNAIDGAVLQTYAVDGANAFELADHVTVKIAEGFALTTPGTSFPSAAGRTLVARRFYEEGLRAFSRGEWRAAYHLFSAALTEDSTFAMAAYYAGMSVRPFRTDSQFILLVRAERLARHAPDRDRLLIKYARHLYNSPVRAAVAESLTVRFPNEPDGPLAMTGVRIAAGDFSGALPYARRVIEMDSLSLQGRTPLCRACEAFRALLFAYAALGVDSMPAVERAARDWIRRQPRSSSAWLMLSKSLALRGRKDEALEALNKTAQLEPALAYMYEHPSTMPAVIFEGAVINDENYREAEQLLRDRLRFDSRDQETIWWLVTALRNQGRITEASSLAKRAQQFAVSDGKSPGTWENVEAQLLFDLGRFREAAPRFQELMRVRSDDPTDPAHAARLAAHAATAWAAARETKRLPALADTIERLARFSAHIADRRLAHYVRGLIWQAEGKHENAAIEFRAAVYSQTLGYTRINLELARTLISLGQFHEATRILRSALAGSSDGPGYYVTRTEVHEWLARNFEAVRQPDSAAVHYRKVAEAWKYGDAPFRVRANAATQKLRSLER